MPKTSVVLNLLALAAVIALQSGCETTPPIVHTAPPPPPAVTTLPATSGLEIVAELEGQKITRADLDSLLYESYGLRMLFDIVELDMAKNTVAELKRTVTPADIRDERDRVFAGLFGEDHKASYDDLFNQFLKQQHLTRAEFEIRAVETNAYLRKIVAPEVQNKLPEPAVHRAFEQLYGAKRQIADIELANAAEAARARAMLKTQSFAQVARAMSLDRQGAETDGTWMPFSIQSPLVPQVIKDNAFAMNEGQISDDLKVDSHIHIIKLLKVIEPKVVKFEDVKDDVQHQLENQMIESTMKKLRDALTAKTQQQIKLDDPILKAQWDAMLDQQKKPVDRDSVLKKLSEATSRPTTGP